MPNMDLLHLVEALYALAVQGKHVEPANCEEMKRLSYIILYTEGN